jgi:diguanylate cyclase (GGDEF)-like protein/PAS domain S-box-containing protein
MDKLLDQISAVAKERDDLMLHSKEQDHLLSLAPDLFIQFADQVSCAVYQFSTKLDKILYINPALEKWWGQSRETFYKNPQTWFDCLHPDDITMVKNALSQLTDSKTAEVFLEYRLKKPDGNVSYIQNRCVLMKDEKNHSSYILGIAVDISNYVRSQQQHFIFEQVLSVFNFENSDEIILNAILKVICQSFDWDEGEIWVHNHLDESLYCISLWHRLGRAITPFYDITYHMVVKAGVGFSDLVIQKNAPVLENNFSNSSLFYRSKMAKIVGLNTALGLPIVFKDELIGVLNFFNRKTKNPSAEELQVMQKISGLIGSMIQKMIKLDKPDSSMHQDDLTGLTNRVGFELLLTSCIENINSDEKLAVVIVDLDKFKAIIESYGNEIGDILLKQLSFKFIQALGHNTKIIAHLDADVYGFIFDNLPKIEILRPLLDNILVTLQKPFVIKDQSIHVKASIGVSIYPDDGSDAVALLKNADIALKQVKSLGGNAIQLYNKAFDKKLIDDVDTENSLRYALSENQFKLLYQPRIDSKSGQIVGVEALLRWQDPVQGLKLPDAFMNTAEALDLAVFIDEWALLNISNYFSLINHNLPVSINLSERQFKKSQKVLNLINQLIDEFSINPALLQIEITEKAFMTHAQDLLDILQQLKNRGITIALNDFGTEFSSFNNLQQLQPSRVKIDKSFVTKIPNDAKSITIVKTVIGFCHSLGIKVIAEEIETAEQVSFLIKEGCDELQGPYFSKPLSIYEIKTLLDRGSKFSFPG